MKLMIPKVVALGFNPEKVQDEELRAVIADNNAWLIWLCWRPMHVVAQDFNKDCLAIAGRLRAADPQNAEEAEKLFYGMNFTACDVKEWIDQFWLYFRGHEQLQITIPGTA